MKKVSIIIASYNSGIYIAETIESCLNQTYKNIEIIIVDDGSTDNTIDIVQKYIKNNLVHYFRQENKGQCTATNLGIEKSTGDFIQFLDADDLLDPNKIFSQIKMAEQYHGSVVAVSRWARFITNKGFGELEIPPPKYNFEPKDWINYMWKQGMMPNSGYLIPKSICQMAGPYVENLTTNNDFEYFSRIALNSDQIIFCEDAICYYRTVEGSLSQGNDMKSRISVFNARKLACEYLIKKYPEEPRNKEAIFYAIWYFTYNYRDSLKLLFQAYKIINKETKGLKLQRLINSKKIRLVYNIFGLKGCLFVLFLINKIKKSLNTIRQFNTHKLNIYSLQFMTFSHFLLNYQNIIVLAFILTFFPA